VTGNRQVRLAARPQGLPTEADFDVTEAPAPEPADGQLVVQVRFISLDPAMRGWMNDAPSYIPPVRIGEVMRAGAVGRVVASRHPDYAEGDHVSGALGVQQYAVSDGSGLIKVDPEAAALPVYLGALGMTGMTAYFGLLEIGRPEPGQTVVVSGAAGAVGSAVGQIAKLKGCRAVGIAGGEDKVRFVVEELGFDACIDYKAGDVRAALREHAPDGVDVYFDNVGNPILDAVLTHIARGARVVICGAIAQYNADTVEGPSNYLQLLVRRSTMQGFVVFDYADRYAQAAREIAGWMADGRFTSLQDIVCGSVDTFPQVLQQLFDGDNVGKLVLEVQHV